MLSALRVISRQVRRGFACKVPAFPEVPCQPKHPRCHHVPDNTCEAARSVLNRQLPRDCEPVEKCCVLRSAHKRPCEAPKRPKPCKPPREPFRSMWEPPCVTAEQPFCKDLLPRFDAIYYHPSYKCRCFQRTWQECPRVRGRLRKVCCLDRIEPPEVLYRVQQPCPPVCGTDTHSLRKLCEKVQLERDPACKCPKLCSPGCAKLARCNPRCWKHRAPSKCTKLRAPYPSYSEQVRPMRPLRGIECRCLDMVPKCVYLREQMRRLSKIY